MNVDPVVARYRFEQALEALQEAYKRVSATADDLPELPTEMTGEVFEFGVDRIEGPLERIDDGWYCATSGYDAYSDGEGEYVVSTDGEYYRRPDDITWN